MTDVDSPAPRLAQDPCAVPAAPARRGLFGFIRDRRGVAAVEFALILPVMIAFYFGLTELSLALQADRKVRYTSATIADLVSRNAVIDEAAIGTIMDASNTLMFPLPVDADNISIRIVTATMEDDEEAEVTDCRERNDSCPGAGSDIALPDTGLAEDQPVLLVRVRYQYESLTSFYLDSPPIMIEHNTILQPRNRAQVEFVA
jgi:hypothetical protein